MTPSRWRQIEDLFHGALERTEDQRAAFLDDACAGDSELRREVGSLLAEHAAGASFLNQPAWAQAEPAMTTALTEIAVGVQMGAYKIEGPLGEGGMGVVYKGLDTKLHRPVAVKVLSTRLADAAARRRFQREAQTASSLNHPHIVTVYDAGEFAGQQYLVTELIDGGSLRDWSKTGHDWREIVELLTGAADGLAAAHDAKILHRDIKPGNILVMKSGYAKLADFGLAKLTEEPAASDVTLTLTEQRTRTGMVLGTVAYMSPEQAQGKELDARSDIFSFGVVLYELLAGHRPFDGRSTLDTLQNVIHAAPVPLGNQVPSALRAIIEKALEKDPGMRYQRMRDMVADLRALTRSSGVLAAPEPVPQPRPAAPSKHRPLPLKGAVAAAFLLALAGGAWYLYAPKGPVVVPSEFVQLTDFSDYATAPAFSRDGTMVAFFRGGTYFLGAGQVYVKLLASGDSKQLTDDQVQKYDPVFTPDGSRIAYTTFSHGTWETWTVPVLGGAPSRLMQNAAGLSWISPNQILFSEVMSGTAVHMGIAAARGNRADERAIYFPRHERGMAHNSYASPDQRSVLVVEMDRLQAWQRCRLVPLDGSSEGAPIGPEGGCTAAGWSPDGKWMYLNSEVNGATHLWRQRYPDGAPQQLTFGPTEEEGLAIAPDGKSLITSIGRRQSSVYLKDSTGEHKLAVEGSASLPVFSRDGKRLYYMLQQGSSVDSMTLWARELASGKVDPILTGQDILDYDVSPDEKEVAFTTKSGQETAIYIAAVDRSSPPRLLTKDADEVNFSGENLIFRQLGEEHNYLARIHRDGTGLERVVESPVASKMDASPDGAWVVAGGTFGVEKEKGTFAISLKDKTRRFLCQGPCLARWSGDGKFLFLTLSRSPPDRRNSLTATGRTLVIPLSNGLDRAPIPPEGFEQTLDQVPNEIQVIRQVEVAPAFDADTYAYVTGEFQGNLFRIPLH